MLLVLEGSKLLSCGFIDEHSGGPDCCFHDGIDRHRHSQKPQTVNRDRNGEIGSRECVHRQQPGYGIQSPEHRERWRIREVKGHEFRREGDKRHEKEHEEGKAVGKRGFLLDQGSYGGMRDPDAAHECKTDDVREEHGPLPYEGCHQAFLDGRDREIEHEQRDHDRKYPVGECIQPTLGQKIHCVVHLNFSNYGVICLRHQPLSVI